MRPEPIGLRAHGTFRHEDSATRENHNPLGRRLAGVEDRGSGCGEPGIGSGIGRRHLVQRIGSVAQLIRRAAAPCRRLMDHDHGRRMQDDLPRRDQRQGRSGRNNTLPMHRHAPVPLDLGHQRGPFQSIPTRRVDMQRHGARIGGKKLGQADGQTGLDVAVQIESRRHAQPPSSPAGAGRDFCRA